MDLQKETNVPSTTQMQLYKYGYTNGKWLSLLAWLLSLAELSVKKREKITFPYCSESPGIWDTLLLVAPSVQAIVMIR